MATFPITISNPNFMNVPYSGKKLNYFPNSHNCNLSFSTFGKFDPLKRATFLRINKGQNERFRVFSESRIRDGEFSTGVKQNATGQQNKKQEEATWPEENGATWQPSANGQVGIEDFAESLNRGIKDCHLASEPSTSLSSLLYLPYMEHQWDSLLTRAKGLQDLPLPASLSWQKSTIGREGARCENWLLRSERIRRIRLTYFDAGEGGQAFNSLWYPEYGCDLPLLGIDLLAFGKNKILCGIDFQPISNDPQRTVFHTEKLSRIHEKFTDLCSEMSTRHFDIDQFFSPCLILYKSDKGSSDPNLKVPGGRLFEVYKLYLKHYLDLIDDFEFDWRPESVEKVKEGQKAYDRYSEERDPAIKLFTKYFGAEWSQKMTNDFLFPGAKNP